MTTIFSDGSAVQVGLFGYESMIGLNFNGVRRSVNHVEMRMAGKSYSTKVADAQAEFSRGGEFQKIALDYMQTQFIQATQTCACNAKHDIGSRLARWLLLSSERAGTKDLVFTQDVLAIMLGVRRTSVAVVMGRLKDRGCVSYARSHVKLLDITALEARACEYYGMLKDTIRKSPAAMRL